MRLKIRKTNDTENILINNIKMKTSKKNKKIKIKEVFKVVTGGTPSLKENYFWGKGVKWFATPDFRNLSSGYLTTSTRELTCLGEKKSRICPENTVLVSCIATVGEVAILKESSAFNQQINGILPNDQIESKYLRYIFLYQKSNLINYAPKNVIMNINKTLFENYEISYNSNITQQKNISYLLNKQEDQVERIKTLIEKVELRNSYYAEKLLSGKLRLRVNEETGKTEMYENTEWENAVLNGKNVLIPKGWKVEKISNIIHLEKGTSIKSDLLNYDGIGVKYLRTNEIWDGSTVNKDEIFYSGNVDNITTKNEKEYIVCFDGFNEKPQKGTVGMVTNNGNGICSSELKKIKEIDGVSQYYVNVMLLKNIRFQKVICKNAEGTTVKHAGKHFKNIEEFLIPYEEQKLLNIYFEKLLNEVDHLKLILPKEEKRFQWMLDNLLSGEYEVIDLNDENIE